MFKGFAVFLAASVLLAFSPAFAADNGTSDGTIALTGKSVAAGVGYTWEKGTLTYKGKTYPITVSGLDVADVGATRVSASGKVYDLKRLEDFDGTYASLGAGAALGGGVATTSMKNQNGVKIDLGSTTEGAKLTFAAGGVSIKVEKHAAAQ